MIEEVITPQFHISPQIHKLDIPGRLVVISIYCHTGKISKFVEHYLQLHADALPLCITSTSDFINKIRRKENITKIRFLYHLILNYFIPTFHILKG